MSTSVRFLHSADWQLGATRWFLDADSQARWSASRFDAIRKIGSVADDNQCEFVVVAGDVFESNQVDRRTILRACEALSTITVPVFLLPGNHDPLDAGTVFESQAWLSNKPENAIVLADECSPYELRTGVEIVGAPWRSKQPLSDLVGDCHRSLESVSEGVRVMVGHGATDSMSPDSSNPALINTQDAEKAMSAGVCHYLALGDRHSKTSVGSSGRIWYSGTPEVYAFREVDPGHCLIVTLTDTEASVESSGVGSWKFLSGEFDVYGHDDILAIEEFLQSIGDKELTVVRLTVKGTVSLRDHARLITIIEKFDDLFAGVHESETRSQLVVVPNDADFSDLAVTGYAQTAVDRLRKMAEGEGTRADQARDALSLLVRLIGVSQ